MDLTVDEWLAFVCPDYCTTPAKRETARRIADSAHLIARLDGVDIYVLGRLKCALDTAGRATLDFPLNAFGPT